MSPLIIVLVVLAVFTWTMAIREIVLKVRGHWD